MREFPSANPRTGQPEPLVLDGLTGLGAQDPARHAPGRKAPEPAHAAGSPGRPGRMRQALARAIARMRLAAGTASCAS